MLCPVHVPITVQTTFITFRKPEESDSPDNSYCVLHKKKVHDNSTPAATVCPHTPACLLDFPEHILRGLLITSCLKRALVFVVSIKIKSKCANNTETLLTVYQMGQWWWRCGCDKYILNVCGGSMRGILYSVISWLLFYYHVSCYLPKAAFWSTVSSIQIQWELKNFIILNTIEEPQWLWIMGVCVGLCWQINIPIKSLYQ